MDFNIEDLKQLVAEQAIHVYLLARQNQDLRRQLAALQAALIQRPED